MIANSSTQMYLRLAMVATFIVSCEAGSCPPVAAASRDAADSSLLAGNQRVSSLIEQLGASDYHLRRRAEQELLRLGTEVLDQLQQVEDHADLEIAARASYLLQKIEIRWEHPEDSEEVRMLLHGYESISAEQRKERMEELAALKDQVGLAALCRIARFEPSLQLARYAAIQILSMKLNQKNLPKHSATLSRELGTSRRVPVQWIRTYVRQVQNAELDLEEWLRMVDDDIDLLAEDSPETSRFVLLRLIYLNLEMVQKDTPSSLVSEFLMRRIDVSAHDKSQIESQLYQAFMWILEKHRWDASKTLEDRYAEAIDDSRFTLYLVALIRWKQGEAAAAVQIADRAHALQAEDTPQRELIGTYIGELYGRHDWATREWQYAADHLTVWQARDARQKLATYHFHDKGDSKQAAKLLNEVCDVIEADPKLKSERGWKSYFAQHNYFRACQAANDSDFGLQRKLLESSYKYENLDADVLIAMYRSPEADEEYRRKTLGRLERASAELEEKIKQNPDTAQPYNHWAWLISNTEGDYDLAIERSKRSLELSPDNPSYLDTLGRCYFAAGKIEEAIEVQQKAVSLYPHLQVMQEQLDLFERTLAAKK